uniref:RNA-dependent RNA polymerase n=1 Tax=Crithidia otongatchiensis virus TaxID=2022117 RepID=A0A2R2X360_9VIRU|nr:RNA-dependent RNA polymerase [Crithidia otongatchiensis virus]
MLTPSDYNNLASVTVMGGTSVLSDPKSLKVDATTTWSSTVELLPGLQKLIIHVTSSGEASILTSQASEQNPESFELSYDNLRDLPHELVCHLLFGSKSGVNITLLPIWDTHVPPTNITPDWFYQGARHNVVAEVKTCRAMASRRVSQAVRQYSQYISMMKNPTHCLYVVASPGEVVFPDTLDLSQQDAELICSAVSLAQYLQDKSVEAGLPANVLGANPIDRVIIPQVSIPQVSDDPLIISRAMQAVWTNESSNDTLLRSLMERVVTNLTEPTTKSPCPKVEVEQPCSALLRQGLFLVTCQGLQFPEEALMSSNSIVRELCKIIHLRIQHGKEYKHVSLPDRIGDWLLRQTSDYCHGLWGDALSEDESLFRHKDNFKKGKEFTASVLQSMGLTLEQVEGLRVQKNVKRIRGQKAKLLPQDSDITPIVSLLHRKMSLPEPLVEQWLDLSGEYLSMPFSDEAWFHHVRFWQRLVEEINIGRYSARGQWKRFHIQKIEPYDAWLLVHGTGPDSHQFYYCIAHLRETPNIPADWESLGSGWWCTKVVQSLRSDKLSQHLNILETLCCIKSYWVSALGDERARSHFTVSFLAAFDAKQATIDALSLFRYVYMELTKEVGNRDPAKVLTKLDEWCTTPFQAFVHARMIILCRGKYGDISEDDSGQVTFRSLPSWVDWEAVPNFKVILSLSYLHYASPHPTSTGLHGKVKITGKLLKEELRLPKDCTKIGWSSPVLSDIGAHEFSVSAVKDMAFYASRRLKTVFPTFKSMMEEYTTLLKEWNFSDFATFKKSTRIDDADPSRRGYCFEEVQRLMTRIGVSQDLVDISPYEYLKEVLKDQKENVKNRNVSIFVKDQQTGLREIFVLPMTLRILVKSLEIFSRMVNNTLPNETLSQPSRKHSLVIKHSELSSQSREMLMRELSREGLAGKYKIVVLRFSSSSDAKTWCQQFCMPTFGAYIKTLLTESYGDDASQLSDYFMFILNEMTQKHIHIDQRVVKWFQQNPTVISSEAAFSMLRETLAGRNGLLANDGGIINRSNMMQGIPHETSSSLHASYLLMCSTWLKSLVLGFSKTKWVEDLKFGKPIITTMVSSDDSGLLFSLPVALRMDEMESGFTPEALVQLTNLRKMLSGLGLAVEECKPLFGALVSKEKSTIFAETPVFEFNSKFYVGTSINTAEIKFMTSQLNVGFHSDIRSRISEALSSLSVVLSQGIDQTLLSVIQLMLNRIHLRFLYGPSLTKVDKMRLNRLSIPALGWLPLLPKGFIGMFNTRLISDYMTERHLHGAERYSCFINKPGWEMENTFSLYLKLSTSYTRVCRQFMVSRVQLSEELKMLRGGAVAYFKGEIPEGLKIRLKLLNPGAQVSMSFVDLCKVHMASCYAASFPCITVKHGSDKKYSLIECLGLVESNHSQRELPGTNVQIRRMIEMLDSSVVVSKTSWPRKAPYSFSLVPSGVDSGMSCRSSLILGWTNGFSERLREMMIWAQAIDDRIHETIEETMQRFEGDIFELDSVLRALDEKTKVVNLLMPIPEQNTLSSVYSQFLRHGWSTEESMVPSGPRTFYPDPIGSTSVAMERFAQDLIACGSRVAWGFRSLRQSFMGQFTRMSNDWRDRIDSHSIRGFVELCCSATPNCPEVRIDLRRLLRIRKGPIYYSENGYYQCISGYWYKVVLKDHPVVYRETGTPILLEKRCEQLECSPGTFIITNKSLRLSLSLDDKELQVKFRTPTRLIGGKNTTLSAISLPGIDHVTYAANCEVPGLARDFVSELLAKAIWGGREMQDWTFWEQLDGIAFSSKYTDIEKEIVQDALRNAQAQLPSAMQSVSDEVDTTRRVLRIAPEPSPDLEVFDMFQVTDAELGDFYDLMVSAMEEAPRDPLPNTGDAAEKAEEVQEEEDLLRDPIGSYECMELNYGDLMNLVEIQERKMTDRFPSNPSVRFWGNMRTCFSRALYKKTYAASRLFSRLEEDVKPESFVTDPKTGSIRHIIKPETVMEGPLTFGTLSKGWVCESNTYQWLFLAYDRGWVTDELMLRALGWKGIYRESNPYEIGSDEFWKFERIMRAKVGVILSETKGIDWGIVAEIAELQEQNWEQMDGIERAWADQADERMLHDLSRGASVEPEEGQY